MNQDRLKELVGRRAAEFVEPGMRVGLGTGSTVRWTIQAIGERELDVTCVATSERSHEQARSLGLRVVEPDEVDSLDVAVDGADEVGPDFALIKGGGGAHTREKIVATMSERFIVVVDGSKLVPQLGAFGVPLEILPFAPARTLDWVAALGATRFERRAERSDSGNILVTAHFGLIDDWSTLAQRLSSTPGIVEHGLFDGAMVERVLIAEGDSVRELTNE